MEARGLGWANPMLHIRSPCHSIFDFTLLMNTSSGIDFVIRRVATGCLLTQIIEAVWQNFKRKNP